MKHYTPFSIFGYEPFTHLVKVTEPKKRATSFVKRVYSNIKQSIKK